ncbi:MAG: acetyl-CoA carboxylase biotin carboxyl carrier protein subunit [Bacteroidota bacterium]
MPKEKFITLEIAHSTYKTRSSKKFDNRIHYVEKNPREICSFIPGTVLEIFVKVGSNVKAGDVLVIFEAMKMKNRIFSPVAGKIKILDAKVGDLIKKNQIIIVIE